MKKISIFICLLIGLHSAFAAGLSGKFTIDKSGSGSKNYSSFASAVQALKDSGVSGPVIFNVADGRYEEKITVKTIKGSSDSNTITFQSASKDSSKVILRNNKVGTSAAPGYVLLLDSVAHIIFNQITFQNYSSLGATSAYDNVLVMDNLADSNTFTNCRFFGPLDINSAVSSSSSVIYSGMSSYNYTKNARNTFRNNLISGNYYGIYWYGYPGSAIEKGNVFDHNIIDSVGAYGIYTFYQDSITMTGNTILLRNGGQGIYFLNLSIRSTSASLIANNFISVGPNINAPNYGINCQLVDSASVVYNNVNIYGAGLGGSYAFLDYDFYSTSFITLQNNNFINWNSGAVDYAIYASFFSSEDYNNIVSGGKYPVYFNNSNYSSLSAWKASSYGGLNDVSVNPLYSTNFDLHVHNPILNASASPLPYDTVDIEFQRRDPVTPDIGADEFSPPAISASVAAITNPTLGFCSGSNDVFVTIFNNGVNNITSANIVWYVNDTLQTSFSWTGSLASGSGASIKVGSYNFSSPINYYKIKAYVDSANGVSVAKSVFNNDSVSVRAGISSGTYTIDKSGSGLTNFTSFRAAAKMLNEKGICGAVIFNVADGTYNESVVLDAIPNTSATNTITFQSKSLDSTKVILDTTWGNKDFTQPGYTVKINRCSYINFRLMKFKNVVPGNSYAHVILITGGCNYLNIMNNIITSNNDYSSALNYGSCIYSDVTYSDNYNNIQHNHISGAYYTVNARGCNIAPERGNTILDNLIDGSQQYGIYVSYEDSCTISGNKIFEDNSLCAAGIYGTCESALLPGFPGYVFTDTLVISNNFVTLTNSGADGIFVFANLLNVYFNSVIVKGIDNYPARINEIPLPYSGTLYHTNLYNNIFVNSSAGAVLSTVPAAIIGSDYNDYYTSGKTVFSHFGVSTYTNLSDWTLATGLDSNSVTGNPSFKSSSTGDLHLTKSSTPVIHRGIYISAIDKDIDGDKRTPVPCMGADETPLQKNDAGIASIDSPATGFCGGGIKYIWVSLRNYGTDTLKSANINWSVDGVTRHKIKWTGSLNTGVRTLVKLDTLRLYPANPHCLEPGSIARMSLMMIIILMIPVAGK